MRCLVALAAIALAGCYGPAREQSCAVGCNPGGPCPEGLTCFGSVCKRTEDEVCAAPDGGDGPDAPAICFGRTSPGYIQVCLPSMPSGTEVFTDTMVLDTDNDATCDVIVDQRDGAQVCVIVADQIVVSHELSARGARPLALLGAGGVHVMATAVLDVAGHARNSERPAGALLAGACGGASANGRPSMLGGGGGAGGSFAQRGGAGGGGANGVTAGGQSGAIGEPGVLRGGCPGGDGAVGSNPVGIGGVGGGAVLLLSAVQIKVDGTVNASGGGAHGSAATGDATDGGAGGGGGGAGGMIVLDAPVIMTSPLAHLFSLGGSGGSGGSGGVTVGPGDPGKDPNAGAVALGAPPGAGGGGAGGDGGGNDPPRNGVNGDLLDGGGGGGGSIGAIRASVQPSAPQGFAPAPRVP